MTHIDFCGKDMFKHKAKDGTRNLCGKKVMMLRKALVPKVSQRQFAEMIQLHGVDLDKNSSYHVGDG